MLKEIVAGLAIALQFFCFRVGVHPPNSPTSGVNGTFFSTKPPYHLASLVYFNGKKYGEFPASETKRRGGLVCYKDGTVEAGYFTVEKDMLLWNGRKPEWDKIQWAVTGGGLFLLNGKVFGARDVRRLESLPSRVVYHTHYSFIAVHKDRKKITLGVSRGWGSPERLAKKYKDKYYAILRLDGGSQTAYWLHRPPKHIHNGFFFKKEK